jgi:hypothetical protein
LILLVEVGIICCLETKVVVGVVVVSFVAVVEVAVWNFFEVFKFIC